MIRSQKIADLDLAHGPSGLGPYAPAGDPVWVQIWSHDDEMVESDDPETDTTDEDANDRQGDES